MVGLGDLQQQYLNQIQGYVTPPTLGAPTLPPPVEVPETPPPTIPPLPEQPVPSTDPRPWENVPPGGQRGGPDTNPHQHYRYEVGGLGSLFGDGSNVSSSDFISAVPGRIGAFGVSYGTAFDRFGNAHDAIVWDGAGFIGNLLGGAIGIPGISNALSWGAEELGIDASQVLGTTGLAGYSFADVLNNPDDYRDAVVSRAEDYRDAVRAGQAWGYTDLGNAAPRPGSMGMIKDSAGNYIQVAGDARAPIPGRKPDPASSGSKGPVADGTMGSVNKNIGGISNSGGGLGSSGGVGSGGKGNDTSTQSKR